MMDSQAKAKSNALGWTQSVTLALLAAAAILLRLVFLARKPFWFDECFSVEVSRLRWHDFLLLMWKREANMSLYYLLLRVWLRFGNSPFFIRSLSVIFSVACLPAIFWLTTRLLNQRVAVIAVALLSFNAYSIRYAQEARSYSLFILLGILSSGFFVEQLREPTHRKLRGYVLCSVLAVYAHLYALLLVAAQWIFAASADTSEGRKALRSSWIWIGALTLPLLVFVAKTGAGPIRWIHRPGLRDLLNFAEHLCGNDGALLVLIYGAICWVAIIRYRGSSPLRFLLIWLLFPVVLVLLLSFARPLFVARYFVFCLPPLILLAAAGLAQMRGWWLGLSLAVGLLLSLQGTLSYYERDFDLDRDAAGDAANYLFDHAVAGDAILFHIAEARVPYEFFGSIRRGSVGDRPEVIYPRHAARLDYRDFAGKPADSELEAARAHARVWVFLMYNEANGDPDASTLMLQSTLGGNFPRVQIWKFSQVELRLYSQPHD